MGNHKHRVGQLRSGWLWSCACGGREEAPTRQSAEDAGIRHDRLVEQARAHLMPRTPSLEDQRNYYQKRATEEDDPAVAEQWQILADGLSSRIGSPPKDEPMFEIPEEWR